MIVDMSQHYEKPALAQAFNLWVDIHAPIALVFRFLTEEKDLAKWWCSKATSEPKPGGRIHYVWRGDQDITGDAVFRRFDPPNHVTIEWTHRDGQPIVCNGGGERGMTWPALNIYELAQINADTTRLHIHDLGIGSASHYEALRHATGKGWLDAAERLKKVVEHRVRDEENQRNRASHRATVSSKVTTQEARKSKA